MHTIYIYTYIYNLYIYIYIDHLRTRETLNIPVQYLYRRVRWYSTCTVTAQVTTEQYPYCTVGRPGPERSSVQVGRGTAVPYGYTSTGTVRQSLGTFYRAVYKRVYKKQSLQNWVYSLEWGLFSILQFGVYSLFS